MSTLESKLIDVDDSRVDEHFEGVMVTVDEVHYKASKPGWKCRRCGWTVVTQGLPWNHWCPDEGNRRVEKVIGYKITRNQCHGWMFAGTTPSEVAECLKNELDAHDGLSADECDSITVEAYETTQAEIDEMPEFEGW